MSGPVVIVSNGTHIGPRLVEDLRPYCPKAHREEFDAFAAANAENVAAANKMLSGSGYLDHPTCGRWGEYDWAARLADDDHDGIAAGVIFHGSMNLEPIPFEELSLGKSRKVVDQELLGVGYRIYNRWLADFVSQAPDRHIGLAHLPVWDVDATVAEVEWAHEAGLRGVNLPAMRDGQQPEYDKRLWEPLWSVCEERGMPLVTHIGGGTTADYSGLEGVALMQVETAGFLSRRAIWWLIFAGVFERHPGLKLMITETPGDWFLPTAVELDGVHSWYQSEERSGPLTEAFLAQVPRKPSEYMAENVFFGASFASPHEVQQAVAHGLDTQLLWGSDYPHVEGTFVYPDGDDRPSVTRQSLRNTFCAVPIENVRRMVGGNAIDVYGLDADTLQAIATEIGAPTLDELAAPLEAVPADASGTAFRSGAGGWN